jgi:predicted component of type VI protein secretion system
MRWVECKYGEDLKRVAFGKDPISVGRGTTCDLAFPDDKQVSRLHAIIEQRGQFWYVIDQKSTNGTHVNGQRCTVPHPINDGDLIEIGDQRIHVKSGFGLAVDEDVTTPYAGYPHYYVLLKAPQTAPQDLIQKNFEELSALFSLEAHPESDLVRRMRDEIEEAYSVLGDSEKRVSYDASISPKFKDAVIEPGHS